MTSERAIRQMLEGTFICKPTRRDPFRGIGRVGFFCAIDSLTLEVTYVVVNHFYFAGDVGLGTWIRSGWQSHTPPVGCCRRGVGPSASFGTPSRLANAKPFLANTGCQGGTNRGSSNPALAACAGSIRTRSPSCRRMSGSKHVSQP